MPMTAVSSLAAPALSPRDRANNFDAIRFALALCVIYAHSFFLLGRVDPVSTLLSCTGLGREAVIGFFLLSGYLITMSWTRRRSFGEYLKRRILRIYPALWSFVYFAD